ncbi:hypothetical protein ACFL5O_07385 [Myxococcota bacterium]
MKLRALVTAPRNAQRLLRHVGESTEAPPLSPARDPPYFKSPAICRKLGELDREPQDAEPFES